MAYNDDTVTMEDVRIIFRNFAGAGSKYNKPGDRNFSVLLDPETAEMLRKDGWKIKYLKARDEGEVPQAHLEVTVKYRNMEGKPTKPPRVVLISSRGRTPLDEATVELLDVVDIKTVDLIVRPYKWDWDGEKGIAAYLKSIFVTLEEDYLDLKYAELEDAPLRGGKNERRDA